MLYLWTFMAFYILVKYEIQNNLHSLCTQTIYYSLVTIIYTICNINKYKYMSFSHTHTTWKYYALPTIYYNTTILHPVIVEYTLYIVVLMRAGCGSSCAKVWGESNLNRVAESRTTGVRRRRRLAVAGDPTRGETCALIHTHTLVRERS